MIGVVSIVVAIIALLRVSRLEREIAALRRRVDAHDPGAWRPGAPAASEAAAAPGTAPAPPATAGAPRARTRPPLRELVQSLERHIGERLLLYAGMVLVVLATAFFLRYAFEHRWLSPAVRVALGLAFGAAFAIGGQRLARAGYRVYGLFLSGGGFALLFLSIYAAFGLYALIGQIPAFLALVGVAAAAAFLADRQGSLGLAFMAVCGGFAVPFLISTGSDAQITLFTYDAILIAATMYLAQRRRWPSLNLASVVLTIITVAGWMIAWYSSALYLRTELFLTLYCAMFVMILRGNLRSGTPAARLISGMLAVAPVLYHLTSIWILFDHGVAFLTYIVLAAAVTVVASLEIRQPLLRFVGWLALAAPLAVWVVDHQTSGWAIGSVAVAVGVWLIVLAPAIREAIHGAPADAWDLRLVHASGLTAFAVTVAALSTLATRGELALCALVFAGANACLWLGLRARSDAAVHWLGVACSLCATAVAIEFDGIWAVVLWSAEAAALVWVGVRTRRFWFRIAGLALFAVAIGVWMETTLPRAHDAVVVLLNSRALTGLFVIALLYLAAWLQRPAEDAGRSLGRERAGVLVTAHALTVLLVSFEIVSFWNARETRGVDADLARELMLSSWWAAYAGALIAVGMRRHYAPIRYLAIALLALTVAKVFAVDTRQLDGIYRVLAYLVVGAVLMAASFVYQRVRRQSPAPRHD